MRVYAGTDSFHFGFKMYSTGLHKGILAFKITLETPDYHDWFGQLKLSVTKHIFFCTYIKKKKKNYYNTFSD